ARNATLEHWGYLNPCRYVLHDRDKKFCASFRDTLATANVKCLMLPRRSPNLNAFAERWVRSVRDECLGKLILLGESSLRRALTQFTEHYHSERNHQGKGNVLLFPRCRGVPPDMWAIDSMSRAPRRPSQVLLPKGRMNFLTIRGLKRSNHAKGSKGGKDR